MARSNSVALVKRNSKLETFLKHRLDADIFEAIRAYDACIVCSEKEDKKFKFVILTREWLYLTENPPKKLYEAVHLKDIVSLTLVNDFPNFLSGAERENVQHIIVSYLTNESSTKEKSAKTQNQKVTKSRKVPCSHSPENTDCDTQPVTSKSSTSGKATARSIQTYGRQSLSARDTPEQRLLAAESHMSSLALRNGGSSTRSLTAATPKLTMLSTLPTEEDQTNKTSRNASTSDICGGNHQSTKLKWEDELPKNQGVQRGTNPGIKSSVGGCQGSLSAKLNGAFQSAESKENHIGTSGRSVESPTSKSTIVNGVSDPRSQRPDKAELQLDLSKLLCDEDEEADDMASLLEGDSWSDGASFSSIDSRSSLPLSLPLSLGEENSTMSTPLSEGSSSDQDSSLHEATIHIYIMSASSRIYMLMKSAWDSVLRRTTLEKDPEYLKYHSSSLAPCKSFKSKQKLVALFEELKLDMIKAEESAENLTWLVTELKVAVERNPVIKKFFWSSSDMLLFLMKQLIGHLPSSPIIDSESIHEPLQGVLQKGEFWLVVEVMETLSVLFRESEIYSCRLTYLQTDRGSRIRRLVQGLLACTRISVARPAGVPVTKEQTSRDLEILLPAVTSLLFELFLVVEQATWCTSQESQRVSIADWVNPWLEEQLELEDNIISCLVMDLLVRISHQDDRPLNPSEVIELYHELYVLQVLLRSNDHVGDYLRETFREEFTYFVQLSVVETRVLEAYPVRSRLLGMLSNIISHAVVPVGGDKRRRNKVTKK